MSRVTETPDFLSVNVFASGAHNFPAFETGCREQENNPASKSSINEYFSVFIGLPDLYFVVAPIISCKSVDIHEQLILLCSESQENFFIWIDKIIKE